MGVTLGYRTTEPVAEEVRAKILDEAYELVPPRGWWWAESLSFLDPDEEEDRTLAGVSKISWPGYTIAAGEFVEIDDADDELMAYLDTRFIVEQLCRWSREHGLTWVVDCVGEELGTVQGGECDEDLQEALDGFASGTDLNDPAVQERARLIAERYGWRAS